MYYLASRLAFLSGILRVTKQLSYRLVKALKFDSTEGQGPHLETVLYVCSQNDKALLLFRRKRVPAITVQSARKEASENRMV